VAKKASKPIRLGELQLRILQVLWEASGPVGVAEVQRRLHGVPLAYTTVATMLRKMEVRELVEHIAEGRKFLYQANVTADEVSQTLSADLVDRLFSGSLTDAVSHLLESRDVDVDELDALEKLIRKHKRQQ
jgi:predicted transcriptional regulator